MISLPRLRFEWFRRRAVMLTGDALSVFHWRGDSVSESFVFEADDDGLRQFDRYLRESAPLTTYMLIDLMEEEFRQEVIPQVSGADRQALLARKQAWHFRGTPYCHVLSQGREAGGRRDERVLFSAILNPEPIAAWVKLFTRHKVPLAGIYSLPLLSGLLLGELNQKISNTLLVTMQSGGGLRQTYFHEGAVKLSRLAKMPRLGSVPYATYLLAEVEKFQRYLTSLRLAFKQPLEVVVLTHGDLLKDLAGDLPDSENLRFVLVDVSTAGQSMRVHGVLTTPFCDYLFVHLLLRRNLKNHYATVAERSYAILRAANRTLCSTSFAVLLGSLGFTAWNLVSGMLLQQSVNDSRNKALFYESRYQEAKSDLPALAVEPEDIKAAISLVDRLRQHRGDPIAMLLKTSQALRDYPAIQIENIDWTATVPDPQSGTAPGGANRSSEQAKLKGRIGNFNGDFRTAIATVNGFVDALRRLPQVAAVNVLSLPLDVSSNSNMQGSAAAESGLDNAGFELRIVLESAREMG